MHAEAVSTTGLAGGAAIDGVPPGTVFVGPAVDGVVSSRRHHVDGDPLTVCNAAACQALQDCGPTSEPVHSHPNEEQMDAREQLETWWRSLDPDRQQSLIEADDAEPPGWAVASAIATHVDLKLDPGVEDTSDLHAHLVTELAEFLEEKRRAAES